MSVDKEMLTRYILCDCAESDTGKTEFLVGVIDELVKRSFAIKKDTDLRDIFKDKSQKEDRWVVLAKDGKEIIIQTEGDYKASFDNTYTYLSNKEVDVIICASRLDEKIKERVLALQNRYNVVFFQHYIQNNGVKFGKQQYAVGYFCDIIESLLAEVPK